jgi:hypothetical protein
LLRPRFFPLKIKRHTKHTHTRLSSASISFHLLQSKHSLTTLLAIERISKAKMSKSPSLRRIQADIRELALDPSDRYHAAPL